MASRRLQSSERRSPVSPLPSSGVATNGSNASEPRLAVVECEKGADIVGSLCSQTSASVLEELFTLKLAFFLLSGSLMRGRGRSAWGTIAVCLAQLICAPRGMTGGTFLFGSRRSPTRPSSASLAPPRSRESLGAQRSSGRGAGCYTRNAQPREGIAAYSAYSLHRLERRLLTQGGFE